MRQILLAISKILAAPILWFVAYRKRIAVQRAFIDVNAKCPSCGHRKGLIKYAVTSGGPMVEHTCQIDGAKWYEPTIVRSDKWVAK